MTDGPGDATDWARYVSGAEPHDLPAVNAAVLHFAPGTLLRLRAEVGASGLGFRTVASLVFGLLALAGPILAVTVFWEGIVWTYTGSTSRTHVLPDYDYRTELMLAGISFGLALAFQMSSLWRWWSAGRGRDGALLGISVGFGLCALLALWQAYREGDSEPIDPALFLFPVWASLIVAIGSLAATSFSSGSGLQPRIDPANLSPEAEAVLVDERRSALKVLAERGMLGGQDVEVLAARQLGELDQRDGGGQ